MVSEAARALHNAALVIDSHNDTIVNHMRAKLNLDGGPARQDGAAIVTRFGQGSGAELQLDFPKMRQAGINAAFFTVDVTNAKGTHLQYALDGLGFFLREAALSSEDIVIVRRAADITSAQKEDKLAAVLAIENTDGLDQSIYPLSAFYELGVRTLTITHSTRSWAADGCEVENGGGLTAFGKSVVTEMNRLGMLVDVSHLNDRGFWDTLKHSSAPVIATHSCCRALCGHPRNLTDEQLKELAAAGGVVGLTFVPEFVHDATPTIDGLIDHIVHAIDKAGIDHVALGSDFDGGGTLAEDAMVFPQITELLLQRGLSEGDVCKVIGLNHLRILSQVIG
jgi:membrane dipeptidase